jgi:hypothetical protein
MRGGKERVGSNSDLVGSSWLSGGFQRFAPRNQPLRRLRGPKLGGAGSKSDPSQYGACVPGDELGGRESISSIPPCK